MTLLRLALAATFALASAAPAAAQRYTAKQNGELIELADTTAGMNVTVVPSHEQRVEDSGQGPEPGAHVGDARGVQGAARATTACRCSRRLPTASMRPRSTPTGRSTTSTSSSATCAARFRGRASRTATQDWQLVEFKSDATGAWVTCKLDFYKNPAVHDAVAVRAHDHDDLPRVGGRARGAHAARQHEQRADAGRHRVSPDLRAARRQPR